MISIELWNPKYSNNMQTMNFAKEVYKNCIILMVQGKQNTDIMRFYSSLPTVVQLEETTLKFELGF